MKHCIQLISCLVVSFTTARGVVEAAQDPFTVKNSVPVRGRQITPYLRYQVEQAWQQDERRLARLRSVQTEGDLLGLQAELRSNLLAMIGGLPASKTPLNARVTGTVQLSGYRLEKVIFESLPGFRVTAHLYVPDSREGRLPAVLVPCGHSANGKIHYQYICHRLAKVGYVALCWDPVGQGERSQFWDAKAQKSRYNLVCGEHAVLGNLAYLAGANLARWEIWDGIRALDYLLTRPEVDTGRIAIIGTSGGGFQASHIAALDERIRIAVPSCYISALPMRMSNRIFADPDSDPEQDLYQMVASGVDHAGLLLLIYPRPLFLAAAVEDFFLQMIEDAEIVSRFAREKLQLKDIAVGADADEVLLARAIVECLPGLQPAPQLPERGQFWSEIVERQSEIWPICYLLPGGAYIR